MACGISAEIAGDNMFPCKMNLQSWGGGALAPPAPLFLPLCSIQYLKISISLNNIY